MSGNKRAAAAAPGAVLREAPLEVLREADVVPGVPVGAFKVQQVFGRPPGYADEALSSLLIPLFGEFVLDIIRAI